MKMMKIYHGFSLVETAVALIIIGLLIGGLLTPISARIDQQNLKRTDETLEEIKEALLGFAVIHKRLPCAAPDKDQDDDGNNIPEEDKGKEHSDWCDKEGYLPWKDLGVGRYDAWGQIFRYRVDMKYSSGIPSSLKTDSKKKLTVRNLQSTQNWTVEEYDTSRVVAIIFSKGKNGNAENGNKFTAANDATYVHDVYVEDLFDDRLTWLSKYTLMNRLIGAKQWPP
jgi:type II secretory pathway pseudopilin PulG